jgi:CRP-like cAMP-binding protein
MTDKAIFVKEIFDHFFNAPLEVWTSFASLLKRSSFKRNTLIKESGWTEKYLSIIEKGSAGIFLQKENSAICLDLFYEKDFFGDYMSFLIQQPTDLYTMALEDTVLLSISFSDLNTLYQRSPMGLNLGKVAAESLYIHKQTQQIELLTLTAEERYINLLERQPEIIQRTPQKHIASYLGITPESFSRIRKKIKR